MDTMPLLGKRALVCGSTQGIGFAIAQKLAEAGAVCTLFARNEQKLQEAVKQLPKQQQEPHDYLVADFSDLFSVKSSIASRQKKPYHILVNNTGGPPAGLITEATVDAFLLAFQQHVGVSQTLAQQLLPDMKAAQYGRIINIVSISVRTPIANLGVSNTVRGAMASWAKTWANEVAPYHITVNNILPGYTLTNRLSSLFETLATSQGVEIDEVKESWLADIPAKRFGEPTEIAELATFLASPLSSYITGTSIPVDGGRTPTT